MKEVYVIVMEVYEGLSVYNTIYESKEEAIKECRKLNEEQAEGEMTTIEELEKYFDHWEVWPFDLKLADALEK